MGSPIMLQETAYSKFAKKMIDSYTGTCIEYKEKMLL